MKKKLTEKEKKIQREEFKQHPLRRRKIEKIICAQEHPWIKECVFLETMQIVEKKFYDFKDIFDSRKLEGLCPRENISEYLNSDGKVCVLMVNYGRYKYERVQGINEFFAPVCCKVKDFYKYEIGERIPIHVKKWEIENDVYTSLYLYI